MNKFFRALVALSFFIVSASLIHAEELAKPKTASDRHSHEYGIDPNLYVLAKTRIQIKNYDAQSEIYHVINEEYPEGMFLFVTREDLLAGITTLDREKIYTHPKYVLSQVYATDSDILVLSPEDIVKRIKSKQASRK